MSNGSRSFNPQAIVGLGQRLLRLQVRDLSERVHARVRPAGAADRGVRAEELVRRAQQHALHRPIGVLLRLPAAVPRPVVLERELPGRHGAQCIGIADNATR